MVDRHVIEDASWRRTNDRGGAYQQYELDAGIEGVNMPLIWGTQRLYLKTESQTVFHCVRCLIREDLP